MNFSGAGKGKSVKLRDLDLNLLHVMNVLFEEQTLTKTAHRLQRSQPTVSASLAKLRAIFADELFVRSNGIMRPTARALSLRKPVSSILSTIRLEVLSQVAFEPAQEGGYFTIAESDVGDLDFIMRLHRRLEREAPKATLRFVSVKPPDLTAALESGEVDLAIGCHPDLAGSALMQQVLFRHDFACVFRQGHPRLRQPLTRKDFMAANHVVASATGRTRDEVEDGLAAHGLKRRVGLQMAHLDTIPFVVGQTDLVATIPLPVARRFAELCALQVAEPPFSIPQRTIRQVWHRRFDGHARHAWLRQVVVDTGHDTLE